MDALVTGIIYNVMAQTGNTLVNKWMSTHEQMNTYTTSYMHCNFICAFIKSFQEYDLKRAFCEMNDMFC